MALSDVRSRHYTNNVLDTSKFAQTVTIVSSAGTEYEVPAIVRRKDVERHDAETGAVIITEQATVTVLRSALPSKPSQQWRVYVSGETRAYMYSLDAQIDDYVYILQFEREKFVAVGSLAK